jgi:hypothetical protein
VFTSGAARATWPAGWLRLKGELTAPPPSEYATYRVRRTSVRPGLAPRQGERALESLTGSHNKGINVVRFSPSGDVLASGVRPRPSRRDAETRTGWLSDARARPRLAIVATMRLSA